MVAFARFLRKYLQSELAESTREAGLYVKCILLQVVDIHQLTDSGINYYFTYRYSLTCNNKGGEIRILISIKNREINEYFCAG